MIYKPPLKGEVPEGRRGFRMGSFISYNGKLQNNARSLRKNMTPEERHLWYDYLRNYPLKFYRQRIIDSYIADFYCREAKLVIEVDGSQHYTEKGQLYDKNRSDELGKYGLAVIRFTNLDIRDRFRSVCEMIDAEVGKRISKNPWDAVSCES